MDQGRLLRADALRFESDVALKHHFQGAARFKAQIAATAEESDRESQSSAAGCAEGKALGSAVGDGSNQCSLASRLGNGLGVLTLFAFLLDCAFTVLDLLSFSTVNLLNSSGEHDCVTGGINKRREVDEKLGAALNASGTLGIGNDALHVGSGGNENMFVDDQREGGFGVKIGRASCRERVEISVFGGSFKKNV